MPLRRMGFPGQNRQEFWESFGNSRAEQSSKTSGPFKLSPVTKIIDLGIRLILSAHQ